MAEYLELCMSGAIHSYRALNGFRFADMKMVIQRGFYPITAEQLIEGIPMIGAIASSQAENHFTVPYTNLENIRFFADSH